MNDLAKIIKVKRRIKIYTALWLLSVLCFFGTAAVSWYFFNLLESGEYHPYGGLVTGLTITFLSLFGYVLSAVGFVTFAILARTNNKELTKTSPKDISTVKAKKLNSRNNLLVKILLVAIVALFIVTILNDPSILSEGNLK